MSMLYYGESHRNICIKPLTIAESPPFNMMIIDVIEVICNRVPGKHEEPGALTFTRTLHKENEGM